MSTPLDPRREHGGTYFVQDHSSEAEKRRQQIQDQLITAGMGGVLPEQPDPSSFGRILDIGCGTGGWLIETAKTYPSISLLVGVDVNHKMVEYARMQAEAQQVGDRVQFRLMDALQMLEFPTDYFDLVNERFGTSYLRTWDWPKFLNECQRVARPGGVIRLTEYDEIVANSPALMRLNDLLLQAFYRAGHFPTPSGVTSQLTSMLGRYGAENVQSRISMMEYRVGTEEGQRFYEDMARAYRTLVPFISKWIHLPDDYEAMYAQALSEMQQPDFVATWTLLTAWGTKRLSTH
jgi:ubiquinone/menaquinone biosynthesis C-methylase UbiE